MAYYGDYYRGDYYRGDYYRGDPIFGALVGMLAKPALGLIKGAVKGVGNLISKKAVTNAVVGAGTAVATGMAVEKYIAPPVPQIPLPQQPGIGLPGNTRIIPGNMLPGGSPGIVNDQVPRGYHINKAALKGKPFKNYVVKNRSMNVTNPRALRRAIRRGRGFMKMAKHIISFYSPKAPKGRMYFGKKKR